MGDLFNKVKLAIQAQKGSFCSRATKVTPLGTIDPTDAIQYTDCDDNIVEIPYSEISGFNGYIDDCVKGGSPISVRSVPVKLFVQYGTTDCNTPPPPPPPGPNLIVVNCSKGESYVIDPSGFTLTKDSVYFLSFNNNVISNECYTIGYTTSQTPIDSLKSEPTQPFGSCGECQA